MSEPAGLIGRTIARRYRVEERVGGGAMGDVYRARHVELGSDVAIKILRPEIASQADFKERFSREAKTASRLDHPNTVRVLDFGQEDDGLGYLVMEFLGGRDLRQLLATEWPLSDERVVDILGQTLAAMSAAHTSGIIHRDLKPENIMIVRSDEHDHVKVCDFGIAKLIDARSYKSGEDVKTALTTSNALLGTPEYMSPEQARGEPLDARSDLYSVGVLLYLMLTKKLPFEAENVLGVAVKHIVEEPVPPSHYVPNVNRRLEELCLRAMRKDPNHRPPNAKEMRADLRAALGMATTTSSLPAATEIAASETLALIDSVAPQVPVHPRRGVFAALVAAGVLAVAGAALSWTATPRETAATLPPPSASALSATTSSSARAIGMKPSAEPPASQVRRAPRPEIAHPPRATPPRAEPSAAALPSAAPSATETVEPTPYKPANPLVWRETLIVERVRRDVLEQKLAEVTPQINECYRDALFMAGSPIGGPAGAHLSIDASGHVVAVVTASQLPSFQRCAAHALSAMTIPADAIEAGGGAAEQTLRLTP